MPGEINAAQQQAVNTEAAEVLVIAGPGTGKTKTLTDRIAYLLQQKVVPAKQILALTFTKKAAEEMQVRVSALVKASEMPTITTFHGLCYELLGQTLTFVSDLQRLKIVKSLGKPASLKHLSTRELGLVISKAKNSVEPQDTEVVKLVDSYNQGLHVQHLHDFDDLLVDAYAKLQDSAKLPYRYILVDELQDTNRLQYEILKLLGAGNLFVIGDPNQSIYGFRGASGDIFAQFKSDFPDALEITLTANYRSAAEIVRLSNAIFPDQPALEPKAAVSGQVRAVEVLNEYGEADWVLGEIQKAIGGGDFLRAVSDDDRHKHRALKDFAVLYRSRSAAHALQKAVEASGLPYQIVGDGSPYEKPDVQAVIAVLRAIQTGDTVELASLSQDSQRKAAQLLKEHAKQSPSDLAEKVASTLGLELDRDFSQLFATLTRFKTVKSAVQYFDDIAQTGFYDPAADAITLLTIHASKGLEFPVVFLIGMQEGVLPSERGDRQEEKRLFYVAATRAKERLEITYARNRGSQPAKPSSFLAELWADVLPRITDPELQSQARRIAKRHIKRSQSSLF